ncbi:MAG TPA: hypothetical protein DIS90_14050 [Cytophagales bacterium]|nr:hypothetical protein [Cytophagales bacterium]HCR54157.1 hypothetical protein [Cytophagales bacterium]
MPFFNDRQIKKKWIVKISKVCKFALPIRGSRIGVTIGHKTVVAGWLPAYGRQQAQDSYPPVGGREFNGIGKFLCIVIKWRGSSGG